MSGLRPYAARTAQLLANPPETGGGRHEWLFTVQAQLVRQGFAPDKVEAAMEAYCRAAGWDETRAAYHKLAKVYHPDRYSSAELPPEVRDYRASLARRINAAYAALEAPQQGRKQATINTSTPIYSSPMRS